VLGKRRAILQSGTAHESAAASITSHTTARLTARRFGEGAGRGHAGTLGFRRIDASVGVRFRSGALASIFAMRVSEVVICLLNRTQASLVNSYVPFPNTSFTKYKGEYSCVTDQ
jgi:hypothetical protein